MPLVYQETSYKDIMRFIDEPRKENMSSYFSTGLGQSKKMPGTTYAKPFFATRLYLPIGKGTKLVLLDDESVNVYEHSIFIRGDKGAMKLKVTCISPGPDPVPGKCRICNAMIKDDRINRKFVSYLSAIDLSVFTIEKTTYTHTRKLVPLNNQAAKKLLRRKDSLGSLKGGMFDLFRNEQTSPVVGDDWTWIKRVNLAKYFRKSPRIQSLKEFHAKKGNKISSEEALKMLIAPYNYETELEPTPKRVEYFLGYIGFGDAPETKEPDKEETDYNYSDDDDDATEEDFKDFDEKSPPEKPKKKKLKKLKKKKKKK